MTELKRYYNLEDEPDSGHYIDWEGDEVYKVNGQFHRTDGPAVAYRADSGRRGNDLFEWWLDGRYYKVPDNFYVVAKWTEDQIIEWKLTHD